MSRTFDRRTRSIWMDIDVAPRSRKLNRDKECDTVVIGAGIAGISTAYELAISGQNVIVLDRGAIAGGITARTTAHLAPLCDDLTSEMIKLRGEDISKAFYESQATAIDRIEHIVEAEGINCDFRRLDGFLFQALSTKSKMLDDEFEAVRKVGAPVEKVIGVSLHGCDEQPALRYPNQATFHPLKYLAGLAQRITAQGGRFYSHTVVTTIEENNDGVIVTTDTGKVRAKAAVVATNSPISDLFALHTKMAPYRSYAMAFEIRKGALPDALYWDTLDPYHYIRLQPGGPGRLDNVIVGGEDHKTGEADDADIRFEALEAWARNVIPQLREETHRWSGQVLDTIDYAAFIGRNPGNKNIYVHTGDSGQGITHGVVGALINACLILGLNAKWTDVYDPSRKTPMGIGNFLKENSTALKNFTEYLAPGEVSSIDEIKRGRGAILRDGLSKVAAYRDKSGSIHAHSAACTHLGCHLHWNSFETCWDCPCHGSQFAVDGEALNAPAVQSLPKI